MVPGSSAAIDDHDLLIQILNRIGLAEAEDEPLAVAELAASMSIEPVVITETLDRIEALGLALTGCDEGLHPILLRAGRQYLQRAGDVDDDVLAFLARTIDDVHAREALLRAGILLVDQFRRAVLAGVGVSHARALVPEAFEPAVDEGVALDLYASAVALLARLSDGAPAGCVAEEILAVALMQEARDWLELRAEIGELDRRSADEAASELRSLFELFEDDDVLDLFDMREPSDAAVAGQSWRNQQMGVADQRVEAWFRPFGCAAPTGYLRP